MKLKKSHLYFPIQKCPKLVRAIFNQEQFKCRGKFSFEALKEIIESQTNQIGASKMFVSIRIIHVLIAYNILRGSSTAALTTAWNTTLVL